MARGKNEIWIHASLRFLNPWVKIFSLVSTLASVSSSLMSWTSSWTVSSCFCSSNFEGNKHLRRFLRKWNFGVVFRFELPDCWLEGRVSEFSGSKLDSRLNSDSKPRILRVPAHLKTASNWSCATWTIPNQIFLIIDIFLKMKYFLW